METAKRNPLRVAIGPWTVLIAVSVALGACGKSSTSPKADQPSSQASQVDRQTELVNAVIAQDIAAVRRLLSEGAAPDIKDPASGETPLTHAVRRKDLCAPLPASAPGSESISCMVKEVDALRKARTGPPATPQMQEDLLAAIKRSDAAAVKVLLAQGADPFQQTGETIPSNTALFIEAARLKESGIDIFRDAFTPETAPPSRKVLYSLTRELRMRGRTEQVLSGTSQRQC